MATFDANGNGDWICPDPECKNLNFSRRTQCNRCQKEKETDGGGQSGDKSKLGTEIGKAAAEKSRGLFSAEDWQCSKCGNVNWARRQTCNMCNAPKFTEVEKRTGYGGGYNDRGVVEYKERHNSDDDEYDEFGRRKKRKSETNEGRKNKTRKTDSDIEKKNVEEADDDDDEEDDDEDGGDLSKYDLWGSEDEEPKNNSTEVIKVDNNIPKNKENSNSNRSKSASSSSSSGSSSSHSSYSNKSNSRSSLKRREHNNREREKDFKYKNNTLEDCSRSKSSDSYGSKTSNRNRNKENSRSRSRSKKR